MVSLGIEPGAAGWKAQTNPLSFGQMFGHATLALKRMKCSAENYVFCVFI